MPETDQLEKIEGMLDKLVFSSHVSDFIVARIAMKGRKEPITVVGSLPSPRLGETLVLTGEWVVDQKFGEQFRFVDAMVRAPSTLIGIERYLSSSLIKGIGPEMARRITAEFGAKTLDIIEDEPKKLRKISGIGPVRAEVISTAFREQRHIREVMLFLQTHGISPVYASKVFKKFGNASIEVISQNPYILASEIKGIGFKYADKIAGSVGIDMKSPLRAKAGLLYVLETTQSEGHVYYPAQELLAKGRELLGIDLGGLTIALQELVRSREVVREEDRIYPAMMAFMENSVAAKLNHLLASPRFLPPIKIPAALDWIQKRINIELSAAQRQAVSEAMESKVLIVTGGPGTGKTTLLRALIEILEAKRIQTLLAAPTGRAAKRLAEATGREAKTLHRLLEYSPGPVGFQRNSSRYLDTDVMIVDETSMLDISLTHHLLSALPPHAILILVGDSDQLPSVGPGNVLADLITSGKVPTVRLDTVFRQARASRIVVNAHLINQGEMPINTSDPDTLTDFYFIEKDDPEECLRVIREMTLRRIPERFGFDPIQEIQILSPMHKGLLGTENLNRELRDLLNPTGSPVKGDRFRVGDRVMQVRNNYEKEVFNGDIGRITAFDPDTQAVAVDFEGRVENYHLSELDELVPAYSISIHKSQGSEYKAVIIPMTTQHYVLLRRNLLYTAITRGKELVVLVGSQKALKVAVENRIVEPRYSWLAKKI
jgi:exodeoxyribonuclease V alpha subunit